MSETRIHLIALQWLPDIFLIMSNQLDCLYQLILLKTLVKDI